MNRKLHFSLASLKTRWGQLLAVLRYRPPRRPLYDRSYALEPRRPTGWLVALVILLAVAVIVQFIIRFPQVEAETSPTAPFRVYHNQYFKAGDLTILPKDIRWEYPEASTVQPTRPVLTVALHLVALELDIQPRVSAGQEIAIGDMRLRVLDRDADLMEAFIRLQGQP